MKWHTKKVIGLLAFIQAIPGLALDQRQYQDTLKSLQDSRRETQQRIARLGIKTSNPAPKGFFEAPTAEPEAVHSLFTVHDDQKVLRAPAGRFLFGFLYHRLMVSGETTPVAVELHPGQGIFSGLRALGKARPCGEGRVAIDFDRIIARNGKVLSIKGIGEDDDGAYGLPARFFASKAIAGAGSVIGSVLSGLSSSPRLQALGFGLKVGAQGVGDQSKKFVEDMTREKSVLIVEDGTPVTVFLDEEVRF